jgi:flagellar capping protein FliD
MGTVGLSFGSPTSGAGFDVSATVSQIVANLQNVETPWKNQLKSLESQDAVISDLGTMFSKLYNDITSLTDFSGILAEKTGASSNSSVLQLMAASPSAAAGAHTVMVNSLAQTSSGYLAEFTDASAKLSGSITLQVGTRAAQTITLNSSNNTLSGLASAINSANAGVTASVLTDATGSRLSLVSGSSGANGNMIVSNNTLAAAASNTLSAKVTAGISSVTSSALLAAVASPSKTLTGTLSVAVGSGSAQTINMTDVNTAEGGTTLANLESYINSNSTTLGVTASIVTNGDGTSSLRLASSTSGSAGTLSVTSGLADSQTTLGYSSTVTGSNASLTVDGVNLTSTSNSVSNLIPGLTFQLLSPSAAAVQIVIANDNTGVESTINQMVSDYNSLMSAIDEQEGNTASGTPEPLYGSPTLSLLQQQLLGSLNMQNPNGYLASISTSGTTLSGAMTIQVGIGTVENVVIGAAPEPPAAHTIYTGSGSDYNSLSGIVNAINSGNIGVRAAVQTLNGQSTLTLTSRTQGSSGALSVNSAIAASAPSTLKFSTSGYTSTTAASGTLGAVGSSSDALSGSVAIQVGSGTATNFVIGAAPASPAANTIYTGSGAETISDLMNAINGASLGVTASLDSSGTSLVLTSSSIGSAGALNLTSSLTDPASPATTTLDYTSSSDINSLTSLGISVNNDGTLKLDVSALDSLLNTDYRGVVGFFQNANSWGQHFSTMLRQAGTSSSKGILSLASKTNSNIESMLNKQIAKQESYISVQRASLMAELISANEIMQALPTQLEGMSQLYSAITGYNQNR